MNTFNALQCFTCDLSLKDVTLFAVYQCYTCKSKTAHCLFCNKILERLFNNHFFKCSKCNVITQTEAVEIVTTEQTPCSNVTLDLSTSNIFKDINANGGSSFMLNDSAFKNAFSNRGGTAYGNDGFYSSGKSTPQRLRSQLEYNANRIIKNPFIIQPERCMTPINSINPFARREVFAYENPRDERLRNEERQRNMDVNSIKCLENFSKMALSKSAKESQPIELKGVSFSLANININEAQASNTTSPLNEKTKPAIKPQMTANHLPRKIPQHILAQSKLASTALITEPNCLEVTQKATIPKPVTSFNFTDITNTLSKRLAKEENSFTGNLSSRLSKRYKDYDYYDDASLEIAHLKYKSGLLSTSVAHEEGNTEVTSAKEVLKCLNPQAASG